MNLLRRTGLTATITLGVGIAFVGGFATAGHVSGSTPGGSQLRLADQSLSTGASCDDLLRWYVDRAVDRVTPWGWGRPMVYAMDDAVAGPVAAAGPVADAEDGSTRQAVTGSATGTNVQEAGVDEPDIAKSDGRLLVRVSGADLVVYDVSGAEPAQVGAAPLTGLTGGQVLLAGDRAVVIGQDSPTADVRAAARRESGARIQTFDLTDPTHPTLVDDRTVEGGLVAARQTGDVIRVVVSEGLPPLAFTAPDLPAYPPLRPPVYPSTTVGRDSPSAAPTPDQSAISAAEQKSLDHNRAVVRSSTIGDWLPQVTTYGDGTPTTSPLVDCSQVAIPGDDSGPGTLSVVGFDADHPDQPTVSAVATSSTIAYFSLHSLYVAAPPDFPGWSCCVAVPDDVTGAGTPADLTHIYDFSLSGTEATYLASGSVPGRIASSWSMDEVDGVLRVAHPTPDGANAISLLRASAGDLDQVGEIGGLGPGEQIRAMRWFDDVAVMVTAQQVDPLYAISLADPTQPRLLGALHLPGWSSYLHPIGDDRLIGLGQTTPPSPTGVPLPRGKATLFDISDLAHPRDLSTVTYPAGSVVQATFQPHQVTWLPDRHELLTVVSRYGTDSRAWVSVLHVDGDHLSDRLVDVGSSAAVNEIRTLPLTDGRVLLVTDEGARFLQP